MGRILEFEQGKKERMKKKKKGGMNGDEKGRDFVMAFAVFHHFGFFVKES